MTLGIDGLISGLDTTSLINSLMTAEAAPQGLLSKKVATAQTFVTDLQSLNSAIATLATNAKGWSTASGLSGVTASSSSSTVTVAAKPTASLGSIGFRVDALARSQVSVTAAATSWTGGSTVTLVGADGTKTEVAAGSSLADLANNINDAKTGVSATLVAAGTDSGTGATRYRIQLTGVSGASGAFSLYDGTAAEVTAGTAADVFAATGAATVSTAQDAQVTLWPGSTAEQAITSSSNTFTDLLPGVDVSVSAVSSSPVTITLARNTSTATTAASALVSGVNGILTTIKTKSAVTSTTASDGTATVSAGTFTGETQMTRIVSSLTDAIMDPINGVSPSTLGINITRDGAITFDDAAFATAMQNDPAGTQDMLAQIAARVQGVATDASDSTTGSLTVRIQSQKDQISDLQTQIADWDDRLAIRRATLEATYAAMETALSSLKSQSDWLSSTLGSTTTSSSSSS